MNTTCSKCGETFEITNADLAFYDKAAFEVSGQRFPLPPPTHCHLCREQRRLVWRGDTKWYHRKCDLSGKQIVSQYSGDKPHVIYGQDEWWSDAWDPIFYGSSFDVSRPFFDQFGDLVKAVPRPALISEQCENCSYCQNTTFSKNCYLSFACKASEDAYYCYVLSDCRDVVDCSSVFGCERCYECINSRACYNGVFLRSCMNCSDCAFCFDCTGCKNCFGCVGLRTKQWHLFNKPVSEEECRRYRDGISSHTFLQEVKRHTEDFERSAPHRSSYQLQSEDCTGDNIYMSRNCRCCFEIENCEDVAYGNQAKNFKDSMDVCGALMGGELQYENISAGGSTRTIGSYLSWHNSDSAYLNYSHYCRDCFGCIGLRHKRFCILNRQYTEQEYRDLLPQVIAHMQLSKEWGEFFPVSIAPFSYNETNAMSYFPLTREEVLERGWNWRDEDDGQGKYMGPSVEIPNNIVDVDDALCDRILVCQNTSKPYKIIPQELRFYHSMGLPVPRQAFEQRHRDRLARANPRRLWKRMCGQCSKIIETSYAPDRPETVYCESCYLHRVY